MGVRCSRRGTRCRYWSRPDSISHRSSHTGSRITSSTKPSTRPSVVSAGRSCSTGRRSELLENLRADLAGRVDDMRETGVYKPERLLASPQGTHVRDAEGREILNLCANNYLGLADDPRVVEAASRTLQERGFGMASVRFI